MTAHAIIDQIKALPAEEQAKVIEFLEEIKSEQRTHTIRPPDFEEAAERVFDRHTELLRKLGQ